MDARAARILLSLLLIELSPRAVGAMPPVLPTLGPFGGSIVAEIHDVAFDAAGNLFVSGLWGNTGPIYRVTPGGVTTLVNEHDLFDARGLAADAAGSLYVVDAGYRLLTG